MPYGKEAKETVLGEAALQLKPAGWTPGFTVRALPGRLSTLGVLHSKCLSMALLHGRAGRLTAIFGGFRPGQMSFEGATGRGLSCHSRLTLPVIHRYSLH